MPTLLLLTVILLSHATPAVAIGPNGGGALDQALGDESIQAASKPPAEAGPNTRILATVKQGVSIVESTIPLSKDIERQQFRTSSSLFIPLSNLGDDGALWQLSLSQEPGAFVTYKWVELQKDDQGSINNINRLYGSGLLGDSAPPLILVPPSAATHLEIGTNKLATVTLQPLAPAKEHTEVQVGHTRHLRLDNDFLQTVNLPVQTSEAGQRQHLSIATDLPLSWTAAIAFLVDGTWQRFKLEGGPRETPAIEANSDVQDISIDVTRPSFYGKDPWPLLPVTLSYKTVDVDEVEPNNQLDTATDSGWADSDRRHRVTGRFAGEQTEDWWSFEVGAGRAGKSLDFEVDGNNAAIQLELFDDAGLQLLRLRGNDNAEVEDVVLEQGRYFARISGKENGEKYTLSFKRGTVPAANKEIEPNSQPYLALPLQAGASGQGIISGQVGDGDADYYLTEVRTPAKMWQAFATGAVNLELFRGENKIASASNNGRSVSTPPQPLPVGRYLVKVSGNDDYRLEFRQLGDRPEGFEREPNNEASTAEFLAIDDAISGQLLTDTDKDYAYFSVQSGRYLTLTVKAPDDIDAHLSIRYQGYEPFSDADLHLPRGKTVSQTIFFAPGDYMLALTTEDKQSKDLWTLSLEQALPESTTEREPNAKRPQPIYPGERVVGSQIGFDSYDSFLIKTPAGPGKIAYACPELIGWEYQSALVPRSMPVDTIKTRYGKFNGERRLIFDNSLNQPGHLFMTHRPWRAEKYDCAAYWLTEDTFQSALSFAEQNVISYASLAEGQAVPLPATIAGEIEKDNWRTRIGFSIAPTSKARHVLLYCDIDNSDPDLERLKVLFQAANKPLIYTYNAGKVTKGTKYQCRLTDIVTLPQLPLPQSPSTGSTSVSDTPLTLDLSQPDTQTLAAYSEHRQSLTLSLSIHSKPGQALSLSASPDLPGWQFIGLPDTLTLEKDQQALELKVITPRHLSQFEPPVVTIEAHDEDSGRVVSKSLAIPVTPGKRPVGRTTEHYIPESMLAGLNVAHSGLGGRVLSAEGKPIKNSDFLIDGSSPRQKRKSIISGKGNAKTLIIDLAGDTAIPLAGITFTQRFNNTWIPAYPPRLQVELSTDGKQFSAPEFFQLALHRERQYLPLSTPGRATHVRITDPDCRDRQRYCLFVSEIGVIAEPAWSAQSTVGDIDLASPALGGQIVAFDFDIYGADSPTSLLNPQRRATYYGRVGDDNKTEITSDGNWIIGFNRGRAAKIKSIAWLDTATGNTPLPPYIDIYADTRDPFLPMKKLGRLNAPSANSSTSLALPGGTWARYLRFELPPSSNKLRIPDAIKVIEADTSDTYRSALGLWEEDSANGFFEQSRSQENAPAIKKSGGDSRESAAMLSSGSAVTSVTQKETAADWYQLSPQQDFALEKPEHEALRVITLTAEDAVEVGAKLYGEGNELELQDWLAFLRQNPEFKKANPEFVEQIMEYRDTLLANHGDALLLVGEVQPDTTYILRVAEEARLLVIRREDTDLLSDVEPERVKAMENIASILGDGKDAIDIGKRSERLLRGEDNILFSLSQIKDPRNSGGQSTTDFSTALASAADYLRTWPGGKSVVYFGMGGGMMQPEDMDWVYQLEEFPARTTAIFAPCKSGNFFCPDPLLAETNPMHFAAAAGGRFVRTTRKLDIRDALLSATYAMFGPKEYGLQWQDYSVDIPVKPATLTVTLNNEQSEEPEDTPSAAGLSLILDGSGSMLQRVGNQRRIDIAKQTLLNLIDNTIPEGTPTSLRVFGLQRDGCLSEATVALSPMEKSIFTKAIRNVKAVNLAKTPIAASLQKAADDLQAHPGPKTLVLITDGEETCDGSVEEVLANLEAKGIDAQLQIVGFAIDDAALKTQFQQWSALGNGEYFDAQDGEQLSASLAEVVDRAVAAAPPQQAKLEAIQLIDPNQTAPDSVVLNTTMQIPAGEYSLRFPDGHTVPLTLGEGEEKSVLYNWGRPE